MPTSSRSIAHTASGRKHARPVNPPQRRHGRDEPTEEFELGHMAGKEEEEEDDSDDSGLKDEFEAHEGALPSPSTLR